ncbi:MAG: oligoendopeptidase F family protein, partial [Clostridiales bacterium]|nr:oligoendopeptidase F family protein [Clostridiales bacterium]
FSAATAFVRRILAEGAPAVERYTNFLKAGSSRYPIDVLKQAGLDMTSPEPVSSALHTFENYLDRFETASSELISKR